MKIKLLYSPRLYKDGHFGYQEQPPFVPPLGVSMLTSYLRDNGFQTFQDDLDIRTYWTKDHKTPINMEPFDDRKRIARYLKKGDDALDSIGENILRNVSISDSDVIGFSISDDHNFSAIGSTIVLSKLIKEKTGATTVIGGVQHQRTVHETGLSDLPYVDFVVTNNHDSALRLFTSLDEGKIPDRDDIVYNKDNVTLPRSGSRKKGMDIKEDIPLPIFDGLPLDLYRPPFEGDDVGRELGVDRKLLMLPISFVQGCLQGCAFCPNSEIPKLRTVNPERAADVISELSKKHRTKNFMFLNTNINPTYEYGRRFAQRIIDNGREILWSDCANLSHLDEPLLKLFRKSGAIRLVYGMESASPKMLSYINKGITQDTAEKHLRLSHKIGIWNELELIAGMPTETQSDVEETKRFITKNKPYVNYFYLARYILMNSAMSKYPERYGIENIEENMTSIEELKVFNRRFDEINGLPWEKKAEQINSSFKQLQSAISDSGDPYRWANQRGYNSQGNTLHLLYHLYDKYGDKASVVDYFKRQM